MTPYFAATAMKIPHFNAIDLNTSVVAENYPYGRQLTCKMHFFVEYKKNKGWRAVTQSINPKNGMLNKPHAGTYSAYPIFIQQSDSGFIEFVYAPSINSNPEKVQPFINEWLSVLPKALQDYYKKHVALDILWTKRYYPESKTIATLEAVTFPDETNPV